MGYIGNQPFLGTVTGDVVVDGTVGTADLTDGAVTAAKLATTAIVDKLGYTPLSTSGTGATGTWDISISGNAATATTATNVSGGIASVTTLEATTVDATNVEVTNVKAKDGTAAIAIADSTGAVTVSTPTVVSVNSSSTALRITQVGSGNALLVEDSANPDSTPFAVDSTGFVLAGYTANVDGSQIQTFNGSQTNFRWNAASTGPNSNFKKSRSTVVNSYSIVGNGDRLGTLRWFGDDGAAFVEAASVQAEVDGTPGTNDMPGRLVFSTTADGAATPTERMRIAADGSVGITSGNLTFSGTGQRITGDFSNATWSSRVSFQTSTTNGNTNIPFIPNGTGVNSQITLISNSDPTNASAFSIGMIGANDARLNSSITGTGTYLPMTFYTGGSERMRLDTAGNLGLGMTPVYALDLTVGASNGIRLNASSGQCNMFFQQAGSTNGYINAAGGAGTDLNIYGTRFLSLRGGTDGTTFFTNSGERMRIDSSGNVGIGNTAPSYKLQVNNASASATADAITVQNSGVASNGHAAGIRFRYITAEPAAIRAILTNDQTGTGTLSFFTSSDGTGANLTERMRITPGGNVGIGTTDPTDSASFGRALDIQSTTGAAVYLRDSDATTNYGLCAFEGGGTRAFYLGAYGSDTVMRFLTNGSERARFTAAGEFLVGGTTDNGAYNIQCNGTGVWGAGAYVNGSDARLKDNIQPLDSGLDVVKAMRPVTFQYKPEYSKDQSVQPGFIAQELQEAMAGKPYLEGVVQEGPNHLNVAYQNIIPILVKAIQELEAKVAALEAK